MSKIYIVTPLLLIGAFLVTFIIIPKIAWIVKKLELSDKPDARSSHKNTTPTMAGISFFITLILVLVFIKSWDTELIALNFIAALTIIFVIGFKDDLVLSSPRAKILAQLTAILLIFFSGLFNTIGLDGFLGFYQT